MAALGAELIIAALALGFGLVGEDSGEYVCGFEVIVTALTNISEVRANRA